MYRITENKGYNSREVYFDGKPSEAVRAALKGLKMRWNPRKVCWYGFASECDLIAAIRDNEQTPVATDGYMGGGAIYGSKSGIGGCGTDLAKLFRQDLKAAGIKGVTVRCGRGGITDVFTVTIRAATEEFTADGEYTDTLRARVDRVKAIIEAYNYDKTNSMVDYFDTRFYSHYNVVAA